ncbi:MAG: ATP-binding protein [Gemmatimonadales bacterium]|nr:ATP-binding protein [Gemmatimonadales bacterium]
MDVSHGWHPRHATAPLKTALADTPVVCLLGPRQSGKSSLVRRAFPGRAYLSFDDANVLAAATADPAGFVAQLSATVTLDEVQRAPAILPAIKLSVDRDRRPGRFLLTGSANLLLLPTVGESLAGRMEVVSLHPLTEAEKEGKPGRLLAALLQGSVKPRLGGTSADPGNLRDRILRGGYPEAVRRPQQARVRQWHRSYVDALMERDAREVANLRNLDHLARLLTLLALQTAQLLNVETLARQLAIRRETVQHNFAALERLFLVRTLPAWHSNESRRLIKAPKVHLVDSGLAATLTGVRAEDWITHRERLGHLLESFVVQQLVAQAGWTDPDLHFWHYRDKDQVEVDLVITRGRETWGIEVKAGATVTGGAGAGLKRLAERCGKAFRGGALLHGGTNSFLLADPRVLAIPMMDLWTR